MEIPSKIDYSCMKTCLVTHFNKARAGFTLIETLVAISILVIAIAAPMTLASQSLSTAYYARDQITAFHLAQEAIEAIRSVRDKNVLLTMSGTPTDLLADIPNTSGQPFTIDTRDNSMSVCSGTCEPIKNQSTTGIYGYGSDSSWSVTRFTRSVRVTQVGGTNDEVKVAVEVSWRSGSFQERHFTINNNLYQWVPTDST